MFKNLGRFYGTFLAVIIVNILFSIRTVTTQSCVDSRSRAGACVSLDRCPDIVLEFYDDARKSNYGIDFQSFVSNSICGFDGRSFLVCCRKPMLGESSVTSAPMAQLQSSPIIFGTAARPTSAAFAQAPASSSGNVFHFASLGGGTVTVTQPSVQPLPNTTPAPWNNWPNVIYPSDTASGNGISYNTNPIIFQTGQPSPTMATSPIIFQTGAGNPVTASTPSVTPSAGGGGLISQTVPQPIIMSTTTMATTATAAPPMTVPPNACGVTRSTTNRVVGGVEARTGSYPWIAALGYRDEFDPTALKYLCGGSLVSLKYVLTSAHCINSNLLLVRLGAHDIKNPSEPNARDFRVKRCITHESFDLKSISNDIALIELAQAVTPNNFITPICLPESSNFLTQEFVGMNPFIAGWGATKYQGITSNVLRDAQVPIVSRQSCEQSYRSIFNFVQFSDKLICAGNSNVDACQGDSGGPLMLPQNIGGKFYYFLIGVVSYGYECARAGFPGVYTRVASFMPWIKQNMT